MIDLGEKSDLRWSHRIVIGQEEFQSKDSSYTQISEPGRMGVNGVAHLHMEMKTVHVLRRQSILSYLREGPR